jgi:NAD(P)H dehydrogenase (quinone)
VVREPARAPVYDGATIVAVPGGFADFDGMRAALEGVDTLVLVSAAAGSDRIADHTSAIDAARAAGVSHVVYLSFLGASSIATFSYGRTHGATEQHLRASGMAFTFLRDSFYHPLLPSMAGPDGVMRGPAENGRLASISPDDVAEVAAVVTLNPEPHSGVAYDLTGPALFTLEDAADMLAAVSGRPIRFERETVAEAYASRARYDAPREELDAWVTTYTAIAAGELDVVSTEVEAITGHQAETLENWLRRHPETYRHLLLD